MPKLSAIETHPDRLEIERLLASGEKLRVIAKAFGLTNSGLSRHRSKLEETKPAYFESIKPAETGIDTTRLVAALFELSATISTMARILAA